MIRRNLQNSFLRLGFLVIFIKALALLIGAHFVSKSSAWINHTFVDLWSWLDFMKNSAAGGVPYVDFSKEYPVGAGVLYWVFSKANLSSDPTRFLHLHALAMSIVDGVNTLLFYSILHEMRAKRAFLGALLFLVLPTSLILSPVRFEAVVLTTFLLGYRMHRRGEYHRATFWWGIGAMIKIYPALFIAIQEIGIWSKQSMKRKAIPRHALTSAGIFFGIAVLANAPFLLGGVLKFGNISAWAATYRFHMDRPLYWDTVLGVMHLWWGPFPWERYAGAWSVALMITLLCLTPRIRMEAKSVLILSSALLFNRVYSPQFHLWFYPMLIVMLATVERAESFTKFLLGIWMLDLVNISIYPFSFAQTLEELRTFQSFSARDRGGVSTVLFSSLIVLRTLILIWLMAFVWKSAARTNGSMRSEKEAASLQEPR